MVGANLNMGGCFVWSWPSVTGAFSGGIICRSPAELTPQWETLLHTVTKQVASFSPKLTASDARQILTQAPVP